MTIASDRRDLSLRVLDRVIPIYIERMKVEKPRPDITTYVDELGIRKRKLFGIIPFKQLVLDAIEVGGWRPIEALERVYVLEDGSLYMPFEVKTSDRAHSVMERVLLRDPNVSSKLLEVLAVHIHRANQTA